MASHQQDHDVLELLKAITSAGKSLEEQLKSSKTALKSLEEKFEEQKVQLEKTEGSINKIQKLLQENMNQLLASRASVLASNRSPLSHQAESSASRSLQLRFKGKFPNKILTKNNIEDEGAILTVELCDNTGKRVEVGPELCLKDLKVKFLVLDGDFEVEDTDDWTEDDFKMNVATPRKDKAPLLKGNCEVSLSEGAARVRGISFTDNSKSTTKNGYFRLGAQVTRGLPSGWVVKPAVSEAFQVKEYRLKADQKHETPLPADELYRLKNISKTGEIYRRARQKDVITVMDFLQLYHTDASELQSILKVTGMKWKETVDNAERCNLTNERYKYIYHDEASGDVLILKCDFRIESVTFNGQTSQPYGSLDRLDQSQKEKVGILLKAAYKKRKELDKVYDSINQTPVQAGPGYLSNVEQLEPEEQEQQQPAPFNLDPNVPYVVSPSDQQICSGPSTNSYPGTAEANHVSFQQDVMTASGSLISGNDGGDNSSLAYEFQIEQVADNGLDSHITAANQGSNSGVAYEYQTEQVADNGLDSHITAANQAEQKHETPLPTDFIYRLIYISKSGAIHLRALQNDVVTVMDFLQLYYTDASKLQSILGVTGMRWKCTVDNAQRCNLTNERYKYIYHDDESGDVLILKCDFKIESVTFKGQTSQPYESLDESQKLKVVKLRKAAYEKRKELQKVYDSINQTPVQAGSGYPSNVEQQEQQPPAPPSNMDPSAVGSLKQICSNPAANHGNRQQEIMNASASVQDTALEAGTHPSVAYGYLTEQVAYGLASYPDMTAAYRGELNKQQMSNVLSEIMMQSPLDLRDIDFASLNLLAEEMLSRSANNSVEHLRWFIICFIQQFICWRRRGTMCSRPQKKRKIK